MADFAVRDICSWPQFIEFVSGLEGEWAFRGQSKDWPLRTALERGLQNWKIDLLEGPSIERQLLREFRRRYRGEAQSRVSSDTLFCMALMQHHGAPTRLLDCTYSPFVAARFALEFGNKEKEAVIWCISIAWLYDAAVDAVGSELITRRNDDSTRCDVSFLPLYMPDGRPHKFVHGENPLNLNERLVIQQGVFLCPGDAGSTFVDNLTAMRGWNLAENVLKLRLLMDGTELKRFAFALTRMNVGSEVLFPGLDGFARSLNERLLLMADLARRKVGSANHIIGRGP
jgi:hypothetical protein